MMAAMELCGTFRNRRNGNKYLIVKRTKDRHYTWKQEIRFPNGVTNGNRFRRVRLEWIREVISDYTRVENDELEGKVKLMAWNEAQKTEDGTGIITADMLQENGITEKSWYDVVAALEGTNIVDLVDVADGEIVITFDGIYCPNSKE